MRTITILMASLMLLGCSGQDAAGPGDIAAPAADKSVPSWDEFSLYATATALGDGNFRYEVDVYLTNASGRAYGINVPVEYDPDVVSLQQFILGPLVDCQERIDEPVLMFHDPDPCVNVVSVGTFIYAQGCIETCRIRCDDAGANKMFTLVFTTVNANTGGGAKFRFACEGDYADCTFKVRNCANGDEYFRVYTEGAEQAGYFENCKYLDPIEHICPYDKPYWGTGGRFGTEWR